MNQERQLNLVADLFEERQMWFCTCDKNLSKQSLDRSGLRVESSEWMNLPILKLCSCSITVYNCVKKDYEL